MRKNPPSLIVPSDVVRSVVERSEGAPTTRELLDRIDRLEQALNEQGRVIGQMLLRIKRLETNA
jgi:hypothetical protein